MNKVGFDGSCNFSRSALIDNIESFTVSCDWDGNTSVATINEIKNEFDLVFTGKDENVVFVPADKVRTHIAESFKNKELKDLLEDEYKFIQRDIANKSLPKSVIKALDKAKNKVEIEIERIKKQGEIVEPIDFGKPRFPYESGPREYQKQAFENWKNNKQKGLFAMATGTGKTITSLNCLLEIYNKLGYYKAIILVPTITLVEQWEKECKKFNFSTIIKVCSKYNNWKSSVANLRLLEMTNTNDNLSYIIISTYASFVRSNVFVELNQFPKNKLLLIADEAHNMSGGLMVQRLADIKYQRRIGLSATPERQFDDTGNRKLMDFFGCADNYTVEYSMAEAIKNGALCRYYYYPHIVRLTENEMADYVALTKQIVKIIGFDDAKNQERLKMLLLIRKRIIHKAVNKLSAFQKIVQQQMKEKGSLKYTLVYVPEGNKPDNFDADIFDQSDTLASDPETEHLIDDFTRIVRDLDSHIIVRQFTSESTDRDAMLKGFANGSIDVLTSMKCLDEGVDVPRSELAIFCARTGNGGYTGMEPVLAQGLADTEGITLRVIEADSAEAALALLDSGEADMAMGRIGTDRDLSRYTISESYGNSGLFFVTTLHDYTDALDLMAGYSVGIMDNVSDVAKNLSGYLYVSPHDYNSVVTLGEDIKARKISFGLCNERDALTLIKSTKSIVDGFFDCLRVHTLISQGSILIYKH